MFKFQTIILMKARFVVDNEDFVFDFAFIYLKDLPQRI